MPGFEQEKKATLDSGALQEQNTGTVATGSDPSAKNEQMTQGVDLAHGNLSELLARGESISPKGGNNPYDAFNFYKSNGKLGNSYFGLIDNKPISEHTFESLENLSSSSTLHISYTDGDAPVTQYGARLFALGKYQIIPSTRESARVAVGLKKSDLFSAQNQDLCFTNYLIKDKRPAVMKYLTGNGSLEAAALAIAQEWASVGIKPGTTNGKSKVYIT